MATYSEMVQMVRDYSNRDTEVISNKQIKTFMEFAIDNAYRQLRVAPLEAIYHYPLISKDEAGASRLGIPTDLIEIIQLRKQDANSLTGWTPYVAKSDIQSFLDEQITKYDNQYYAREGDTLRLYPEFSEGDEFELYYYRRLPAIDARFTISFGNYVSDLLYHVTVDVDADSDEVNQAYDDLLALVRAQEGDDVFDKDPDLTGEIFFASHDTDTEWPTGWYLGRLASHWLRDYNEKVILFGALAEMFTYLNEPESAQLYSARFSAELEALNREDNARKYMGGNVQTHFRSHLL